MRATGCARPSRGSAGQGPGQELPVRQHQHPRAEASAAGPGPAAAPQSGTGPWPPPACSRSPTPPPPPTGPAGTRRPGTGSTAGRRTHRSPGSSGTSVIDPSIETIRSPQQKTPGRAVRPHRARDLLEQASAHRVRPQLARPRGTARRCSAATTAVPARHLPQPPVPDGLASRSAPQLLVNTARRPASASPARTRSSAPGTATGPARNTPSAAPAAAAAAAPAPPSTSTASSTSSGGKALVSTPIEIRSGSHPSGDRPSEPS